MRTPALSPKCFCPHDCGRLGAVRPDPSDLEMAKFAPVSWRGALAIALLIFFPLMYFYPVTIGQAVWFTRDLSRVYHPFAVELGRALDAGRLPLWAPALQAGFPLLAEGQIAALYP